MVGDRDESRRVYVSAINSFLQQLSELPVTDRLTRVKVYTHSHILKDILRQTGRHRDSRIELLRDRQTIHSQRHTDLLIDVLRDIHRQTDTETGRRTYRHTDSQCVKGLLLAFDVCSHEGYKCERLKPWTVSVVSNDIVTLTGMCDAGGNGVGKVKL